MHEAYRRTRKDAAAGIDGQTAASYEADLDANLADLLERLKSGRYQAPPVRRIHIPKAGGQGSRPIGIPTLEDRVAQRAIAMVLEPLYEQDFEACSYGFRPGRSAHQALGRLRQACMTMDGGWVIELDIRAFFDELDWACLRTVLDERVRDGVIRRLIDKWLKAGVVEGGQRRYNTAGTPQGSVLSPLIANVYLHAALDRWFEHEVKPRLHGRGALVRFADDVRLVFSHERDARRVMAVLDKRLARYGLRLHPEKTRLHDFRRPAGARRRPTGFDFLGMTHYWARSRKGRWTIKRRTARDRFRRALRAMTRYCRRNRHRSVAEQHEVLSRKLLGHYAYFGVTANYAALARLYEQTRRAWIKWLGRRSQRGRLTWPRAERLLVRFPLPPPRVVHSPRVA